MKLFDRVELAPADPILGLTEAFVADQRPEKVNLGVGVYLDETGKLPLLECVRTAEQRIAAESKPKGYLGDRRDARVPRGRQVAGVRRRGLRPWLRAASPPRRPWAGRAR